MSNAAKKIETSEVIFHYPQFQISAFGLAHRVIVAMRQAGTPESVIEKYKAEVKGLSLEDAMVITECFVRVIK